jgi:transposase
MATSVEKVEARAVIRFLHLQGKSAREIHDQMTAIYQEGVPSYEAVVRWKRRFHCGQTMLEDEPRSGRPSLAEEPGIVSQVEALILSDRRITC